MTDGPLARPCAPPDQYPPSARPARSAISGHIRQAQPGRTGRRLDHQAPSRDPASPARTPTSSSRLPHDPVPPRYATPAIPAPAYTATSTRPSRPPPSRATPNKGIVRRPRIRPWRADPAPPPFRVARAPGSQPHPAPVHTHRRHAQHAPSIRPCTHDRSRPARHARAALTARLSRTRPPSARLATNPPPPHT